MEELIDALFEALGINNKTERIKVTFDQFNILREKILKSTHPLVATLDQMIEEHEFCGPEEFTAVFAVCIHTLLGFLDQKHKSTIQYTSGKRVSGNLFLGVVEKLVFFADLEKKNPINQSVNPLNPQNLPFRSNN